MRITIVTSSLRNGGAQRVCVTLINELVRNGWKVELVVMTLEGSVYLDRLSTEATVVNLNCRHARTSAVGLYRYLRTHRPERVLVFNHQLAVVLLLLRACMRRRFAIIARSINTLSEKRRFETSIWHSTVVGLMIKAIFKRVDHAVAQSEGMKRDLVREYRFEEKRVTVIHNPIRQDVEDYAGWIKDRTPEKWEYILYVGSLDVQKAVHNVINAFSAIAPILPRCRLKIVGDGPLKGQLLELSRAGGLVDRIDFEGFQKEIIPFYLRARATVLTSLYEGFPNVLCESIALGTPVVAFDCPSGPSEIVVNGENGYLVPLGNQSCLQEKLLKTVTRDWDHECVALTVKRLKAAAVTASYERVFASNCTRH